MSIRFVRSGCRGIPSQVMSILLVCLLWGCVGRKPLPWVEDGVSVYVVDHGKHAGLALAKTDLPAELLPERVDFPLADFLELGWGDWDYYQIENPGPWVTLKAALCPTRSVLHMVGVYGSPEKYFLGAEVIRLSLRQEAYGRLVRFIHESFDRKGGERVRPLRPGYYPDSRFYPARGRFHIFYTCNGWIAEALEAAGFPLGWPRPITADQLMDRIRRVLPKRRNEPPKTTLDPAAPRRRFQMVADFLLTR